MAFIKLEVKFLNQLRGNVDTMLLGIFTFSW